MQKLEGQLHIGKAALDTVDQYFRRDTTFLANTLKRISPEVGTSYLHSKSKTKRAQDLIIGVPAAIVSAPIIGALAGINKALYPSDPAFFRQERLGRNNSTVTLVKIRTMKPHSDYSDIGVDAHCGKPAWENPRNTGVGRFMRRFDLDELPQMTQVIKGELSLFGIRNVAPAIVEELQQKWSNGRFNAWMDMYRKTPSGLAALAQIEGSGLKEDKQRFHMDMFYAKHASLGFELYLTWRTGLRLFKKVM